MVCCPCSARTTWSSQIFSNIVRGGVAAHGKNWVVTANWAQESAKRGIIGYDVGSGDPAGRVSRGATRRQGGHRQPSSYFSLSRKAPRPPSHAAGLRFSQACPENSTGRSGKVMALLVFMGGRRPHAKLGGCHPFRITRRTFVPCPMSKDSTRPELVRGGAYRGLAGSSLANTSSGG